MIPSRFFPLVLLLVASSLFFLRLDCALLEPEEARYAEIPREMLAAHEWIVPQYHGQVYYDKPPLLYWTVMLSYCVFGVNDWAARLVPGVCGVLCVMMTFFWGLRILGAHPAFFGALVLALSCRFVYLGRLVATDAPLSLCIVTALACLHIAVTGPTLRWRWWLAGGIACGMGLLTKGPVAFVLVGVPLTAYLLVNSSAVRPRIISLAAVVGAALLTAAPWYVAVIARDSSFAEYFFWRHHVVRYVAPFDHAKPVWFYLPTFVAGTMPWCLLLVPLASRLWSSHREMLAGKPPEVVLPLAASLWCVLFFSMSGSKRVGYVLPAFAPFALVIGEQVDFVRRRFIEDGASFRKLQSLPLTALAIGIAACAGLAAFEYLSSVLAIVLALFLGLILALFVLRGRGLTPLANFSLCAAIVLAQSLAGVQWILPRYAERFSLRREVLAAKDAVPASARIICYPRGWDSVSFYLRRDDATVFAKEQRAQLLDCVQAHPEALIFLRDGDDAKMLLAELPPTLVYVEHGRQGNIVVGRVNRLWRSDSPVVDLGNRRIIREAVGFRENCLKHSADR
jgi:dolichol-phosphate mannosyltransferase